MAHIYDFIKQAAESGDNPTTDIENSGHLNIIGADNILCMYRSFWWMWQIGPQPKNRSTDTGVVSELEFKNEYRAKLHIRPPDRTNNTNSRRNHPPDNQK